MVIHPDVEPHIEVHKYAGLHVAAVAFLSLVLQTFLPRYFPRADLLELPLLITLYFGLSRRSPTTGLLLGTAVGLTQDALSLPQPIGLYGIAKTIVGFGASSIGGRIDVEHPLSRFALTFVFFHFHQLVFTLTRRLLLAETEAYFTLPLLVASLVNAILAVALFPLLDRLRKPS